MWQERYRDVHPDVLEAFFAGGHGAPEGIPALVARLRGLRERVQEAAAVLPDAIDALEAVVRDLLDVPAEPAPLHVLMVGSFSANAFVGRLDGEVAVFHCLEWFAGRDPARVLLAHEDTHAWHEIVLGPGPDDDLAWAAFREGLAVQVSRAAVPDRPEDEYFWYGIGGFEDWLPWCRDQADLLRQRFRDRLDEPDAVEDFFGGGLVEDRWRVGFFLADELVGELALPPSELVRMSVDDARHAVVAPLDS
ncbi:MAG TPA: hypothetical protein VHF25_12065 [Nitriliruptorales bacterium]|nr:hypothetical protein [Nitriliruptorales bacterium]